MKKETTSTETTAPALAIYEVLCESVKIGGVIAYRTARVHLTQEQAAALNAAQAGTVRFLGI
jgi:hypothetical protein